MKALGRWLPLAQQLEGYDRRTAAQDLLAGVVLSALLIPAGLSYATAAGLPPITGLYATVVALVVYALLGPSRVLVFGPDSALAPLIAGFVLPLTGGDPGETIALAAMLSVAAGAICLLAGFARFGFLADLLSKPVRIGYLNGIALTVLVGQLPKALGFSGRSENLREALRDLWRGLDDGLVNGWAAAIAGGTLVVVLGVRLIDRRIPGAFLSVLAAIAIVVIADLATKDVSLLGELPSGFPKPSWPDVDSTDAPQLLGAAFGIAFLSFADTSVLSRTYALKTGQQVDPNRELIALGAVNIATGLTQGMPVSSSASRTPVAEDAGAKTQMTGLIGGVIVAAVVLAFPGAFRNLPDAALAGIVVAAALRLLDIQSLVRLARIRRSEFVLAVGAFLSVVLFGPINGIGLAIALSLLNFMRKVWRPHTTELVRVDGLKGYHDAERHPEGHHVPGLLLYRFDAPLFFANGGFFEQDVLRRVREAPEPVQWVVITAEPITDVDSTGADELAELLDRLDEKGVRLAFAELKGVVRDRLDDCGLVERIGRDRFYRTTGEAVHAYVDETGVPWQDWQDPATDPATDPASDPAAQLPSTRPENRPR